AEAKVARARIQARRPASADVGELGHDENINLIRQVAHATARAGQQRVRDDVIDALTLLEFSRHHVPTLPGELDALEAEVLTVAREVAKMSLADLAQHLGL